MSISAGPPRVELSWGEVYGLGNWGRAQIGRLPGGFPARLYPVPRGGIHAAQAILAHQQAEGEIEIVPYPSRATVIVDDLIDSGATREKFAKYDKPFVALVDKSSKGSPFYGKWVVFPWEAAIGETGPEDAITRLLEYIGEDVTRPGLLETPKRVIKSYSELFAGYHQDPKQFVKVFEDGGKRKCNEIVLLKNCEFVSSCEHHMLPFFGKAHIAYVPKDGKVLGLSKLARILDCFARRLQVQERLTYQVADFLYRGIEGENELDSFSEGSACVIEATHMCVCGRGVNKQHSTMVTSALNGVLWDAEPRAELFNLIRG